MNKFWGKFSQFLHPFPGYEFQKLVKKPKPNALPEVLLAGANSSLCSSTNWEVPIPSKLVGNEFRGENDLTSRFCPINTIL